MKSFYFLLLLIIFVFKTSNATSIDRVLNINDIEVKTWKDIRDSKVVKQNLDYSCGAASVATILTYYYKRPTTEKEVLVGIFNNTNENRRASFSSMEDVLPKFGFRGIGLATSFEKLIELKIPVILYVLQRKQDHFTVVSGINENYIRLSDPSLGNRVLTRSQFKEIWETRNKKGMEGKMLAILPLEKGKDVNDDFFTKKISSNDISKDIFYLNRRF